MPPIIHEHGGLFLSFLRDFPEVQLEVTATTRHVDLATEWVDVPLRFGKVRDQSLIGQQLWRSRTLAVASPAYLDASLDDQGIAVLPEAFSAGPVAAGRLETVLPEVIDTHATATVVYPEREFMPPQVRVFIDRLVA
jgi:DNA-binding transcriptional LysR family regulator